MGRGLERRAILKSDEDKQSFVERMESSLERSETQGFAWANCGAPIEMR